MQSGPSSGARGMDGRGRAVDKYSRPPVPADATAKLRCPPGYDFETSIRFARFGSGDPTVRFIRTGDRLQLSRAAHFPEGPATLSLSHSSGSLDDGSGTLAAAAWGPGAQQALAAAADLAGLNDRLPEKGHAYWHHHPAVVRAASIHKGLRLIRWESLGYSLVPNILQQQIEWQLAADIWRKMIYAYGQKAPGPFELRLPVHFETLQKLPTEALVSCGLTRRRAALLREVGRLGPRMDYEWLPGLSLPELRRKLTAIPGIGVWTADHTLGFCLGLPDVVPLGDFALPHSIAWALSGKRRSDDKEMLQLLEPFSGHRFRVIRLLMAAGMQAPRRGPRKDRGRPDSPRRPMRLS